MASRRTELASVFLLSSVVASFLFVPLALVSGQAQTWTLPADAADQKSPLAPSPDVLRKGEALYNSFCASCHGRKGLGDGPYVDRKDEANKPANLTLSRYSEGVVFYMIWNGRKNPTMPAFKRQLTKDDTWALVAYAMSLRQ